MFLIMIPFLIVFDHNWFLIVVAIIFAIIYTGSCIAVIKKGYKNVPPQIVFPLVRIGKKNDDRQRMSFNKTKKP